MSITALYLCRSWVTEPSWAFMSLFQASKQRTLQLLNSVFSGRVSSRMFSIVLEQKVFADTIILQGSVDFGKFLCVALTESLTELVALGEPAQVLGHPFPHPLVVLAMHVDLTVGHGHYNVPLPIPHNIAFIALAVATPHRPEPVPVQLLIAPPIGPGLPEIPSNLVPNFGLVAAQCQYLTKHRHAQALHEQNRHLQWRGCECVLGMCELLRPGYPIEIPIQTTKLNAQPCMHQLQLLTHLHTRLLEIFTVLLQQLPVHCLHIYVVFLVLSDTLQRRLLGLFSIVYQLQQVAQGNHRMHDQVLVFGDQQGRDEFIHAEDGVYVRGGCTWGDAADFEPFLFLLLSLVLVDVPIIDPHHDGVGVEAAVGNAGQAAEYPGDEEPYHRCEVVLQLRVPPPQVLQLQVVEHSPSLT